MNQKSKSHQALANPGSRKPSSSSSSSPPVVPTSKDQLKELVTHYVKYLVNHHAPNVTPELELRFQGVVGGNPSQEIPAISQEDYYHVLQVFKSMDATFVTTSSNEHLLRVYPFTSTGSPPSSKIRCEITGMDNIQKYCQTNDWRQCSDVKFVMKKTPKKKVRQPDPQHQGHEVETEVPIQDVYMNTYAIKASYKHELSFDPSQIDVYAETDAEVKYILHNWNKVTKTFRHMNRFSFGVGKHQLLKIDASIVKSSSQDARGNFLPVIDIQQSHVFLNYEKYELEIEVNNENVLSNFPMQTKDKEQHTSIRAYLESITEEMMKTIRKVLVGLQQSPFPIPKQDMETVLEDYTRVVHGLVDGKTSLSSVVGGGGGGGGKKDGITAPWRFVGPSSVALTFEHLYPNDVTHTDQPFVMENYTVTEKADGERCLLFVSPRNGKVYLIDMNMKVRYTGLKVSEARIGFFKGLLLDGEYITHNKDGGAISLFMAFDLYFKVRDKTNVDYRVRTFFDEAQLEPLQTLLEMDKIDPVKLKETEEQGARYTLLKMYVFLLNKDIYNETRTDQERHTYAVLPNACQLGVKDFFPIARPADFAVACDAVLSKPYLYQTDGLVFTPNHTAVGASRVGSLTPGPPSKKRWGLSLKWKPPQFNTNDFLVTTVQTKTKEDKVTLLTEANIQPGAVTQQRPYKTLELRCGFSLSKSGYPNAFTKILFLEKMRGFRDEFLGRYEHDYMPALFYPTDGPDPFAHLCRVMLRPDSRGIPQMWTKDNEVIEEHMIVEFRYEKANAEGFRWVPLRIRHDKTYEYRQGGNAYGNDYETANGNWNSIMNPIQEVMLRDPSHHLPRYKEVQLQSDAYYTSKDIGERDLLRKFHNYVKRKLLASVLGPQQTLIDLACGKAGDLAKWEECHASFVFGVDYSRDNIENRFDGAAARYLKDYKNRSPSESTTATSPGMLRCVFAVGDVSKNLRNGDSYSNEVSKEIAKAVFGNNAMDIMDRDLKGKGARGFHVCSCQFALHYFFKDIPTLQGFLTNVAENVKKDGYFVGTCFDGKRVFEKLKGLPVEGSVSIQSKDDPKEVYWECQKAYTQDTLENNSSSVGYAINVYQKSIGESYTEYLVNFDFLEKVLAKYGFQKVNVVTFQDVFLQLDAKEARRFDKLASMNEWEVSTLNNQFCFKKVNDTIDPKLVVLDDDVLREEAKVREPILGEEKMKELLAAADAEKKETSTEGVEGLLSVSAAAKSLPSSSGNTKKRKPRPTLEKENDAESTHTEEAAAETENLGQGIRHLVSLKLNKTKKNKTLK